MIKNNIITNLSESYTNEIKKFIGWYTTKKFKQPINLFFSNDTTSQIGIILQYTSEIYNLTLAFNSNVYMISYFDSSKDEAKIIANFKKTGKVTDIVYIDTMTKNNTYEDMVVRGIYKLFQIIKKEQ